MGGLNTLTSFVPMLGRFIVSGKFIKLYSRTNSFNGIWKHLIIFENTFLYFLVGLFIGILNAPIHSFLVGLLFAVWFGLSIELIIISTNNKLAQVLFKSILTLSFKERALVLLHTIYHAIWFLLLGYFIGYVY